MLTVPELKAFFGLRLQMEQCIKPRYEDYWASSSKSFVSETPGFRSVMQRDRFLSIWTHLHFVNELNPTVDKTDKIYKVRLMLDMLLTKCPHFYSPSQCLCLDEGMIPCKGRLAIKQYIKSKPIKWGIKAYMACDSNTGYIMNLEIYTGKTDNVIPELGFVGSVVVRLLATGYLTNKNHMVYMYRFYNSVPLFDTLFNVYGTFAVGTAMTNRKFYPKELTKMKKMQRGQSEFICHGNITCLVWMDQRPIHFISSYHNPTHKGGTLKRRNKDGTTVDVPTPQLCIDYTKYMSGCDVND
uniref:PiggyBac transposable element-derived protein domain-containing protein n=1 Tax=Biomphalaria glabrata TaxID=6526 RepID=A0A2C9K812_BIOGL